MRLVAAASALLLASCATTSDGGEGPRERPRAKDFVPLAVGNAWTYRVAPSTPDGPPLKVRIVSQDEKGFFHDNQGQKLAPRGDGVFDGTRFLLEEPVEPGNEWMAIPQRGVVERYRILSLGDPCSAPAGEWKGCVVVEGTQEQVGPDGRPVALIATWTYAPHVGMVRFSQVVKQPNGEMAKSAEMVLVDYAVAVAPREPRG